MNKKIILYMLVIALLLFSGCKTQTTEPDVITPAQTQPVQTQPATPISTETLSELKCVVDKIEAKILSSEKAFSMEFMVYTLMKSIKNFKTGLYS